MISINIKGNDELLTSNKEGLENLNIGLQYGINYLEGKMGESNDKLSEQISVNGQMVTDKISSEAERVRENLLDIKEETQKNNRIMINVAEEVTEKHVEMEGNLSKMENKLNESM